MSIHGPIIAPSKCPAAVEGDDGTVQGLIQIKTTPEKAKRRPREDAFLSGDDIEYQRPKGTIATGIQNRNNATSISSMPLLHARMFIISPLVLLAVARITLGFECDTPK